MSDVAQAAAGSIKKAPLANGPLQRPFGLRYFQFRMFRKLFYPYLITGGLIYVGALKFSYFKHEKQYADFYATCDPIAMEKRMNDFGVFEKNIEWKTAE